MGVTRPRGDGSPGGEGSCLREGSLRGWDGSAGKVNEVRGSHEGRMGCLLSGNGNGERDRGLIPPFLRGLGAGVNPVNDHVERIDVRFQMSNFEILLIYGRPGHVTGH